VIYIGFAYQRGDYDNFLWSCFSREGKPMYDEPEEEVVKKTPMESVVDFLKEDDFEQALRMVCQHPDSFNHEERKKVANYCLSSMPELAEEIFTISKVKNDTDMMRYAYQHVNLTTNNKLIYAIELGLDAVAEKLAFVATNLDFAIYKCMLLQNGELGQKIVRIKESKQEKSV
jgi:hypothetical protein